MLGTHRSRTAGGSIRGLAQPGHCVVPRPALSGVPRAVQAPPCAAGTVKPQAGTVPGEREAVGGSFSAGELDSAKALLGLPSLLFDTSWLERQGGVEVRWGHLRQLLSRHLGGHKACNRGLESGLCSRREGSPKLLAVGHPHPARAPRGLHARRWQ